MAHNGAMRRLLFVLLYLASATTAHAFDKRAHKLGLGVELGDPTGLTAKYYFDRQIAVQGAIGLFAWPYGPGAHLDLLYEFPNAVNRAKEGFDLPIFFGAGVKGAAYAHCNTGRRGSDCRFDAFGGLRVPFGAALQLKQTPLELQLELVPVFYYGWVFWHGFGLEADAALAARYYF